ncbi:MAG: tetratricopeptide repeat protein [Ignavibacteriaceae bacterium]|nr:tetratricopeptide repeat protein [Ignavibacteriaceae bacterium]
MKSKKKNKEITLISKGKSELSVYLFFLLIVPALLYFRTANFGFTTMDDSNIILAHYDTIGDIKQVDKAFTSDAFINKSADSFYRPLQTVSFMIDAQIGGNQPWIYHFSNLILHLLNVIVLFFFLKKTGIKNEISFLLSFFFSITPLLTNAVAWIPARGDLLLCLFILLSFITCLDYLSSRKIAYMILHAIFFTAAMFSKETAILLPLLIIFYIYFAEKKKFILKDIIPFIVIWCFSFVLFYFLRQGVINASLSANIFGIIPFTKNLPAIPITFGKLFIPYNLTSLPLFDNPSLATGCILVFIFFVITIKFSSGSYRDVVWGGIWFIAFLIPPMLYRSYIADIAVEYYEYRAYLPVIGILIIIGVLLNKLSSKFTFHKILIAAMPVLIIYAVIAFIHSSDFADPVSFFTSAIRANSNNAMAFCGRGIIYYNSGIKGKALADYESSIRISPTYPLPYFNKGVLYGSSNDHSKAEQFFSQALKYDTLNHNICSFNGNTYYYLSREKMYFHKYEEAISLLRKGTHSFPDNGSLHNNLGKAYYAISKYDPALYEFNRGIELEKTSFEYYDNRGLTRYQLNDFAGALVDFDRALEIKPDFPDTWGNRGMARIKLNNYKGAISDLGQAISMNPKDGAAWYYRGLAYYRLNKYAEARENMNKAIECGFNGPEYLKSGEAENQIQGED